MGYDCTLHVIDERAIRARFVPRLLGRPGEPSPFDDRPDALELLGTVRTAMDRLADGDEPPGHVANLVCQLAIVFCASELPYHYERGFCLSLWPDGLTKNVPAKFFGDPEPLFGEVVAEFPGLAGQFPRAIESNFGPGCFVPSTVVPGLLTWVKRQAKALPRPDRRQLRGLTLVLEHAAARGLAYWEGTDLPVPGLATLMPPADQRQAGLEEVPSPDGIYMQCVGRSEGLAAFAHGVGFPKDCRTAFLDLSAWPPRVAVSGEYTLSAARSRRGRWVTASMTPDRPYLYRVRVSDQRPDGEKTLLLPPDERENGIPWAGFLGERAVAVLGAKVVYPSKTLLPAYPLIERDGRLVPVDDLPPSRDQFPSYGVIPLNDGADVFLWDGDGYELRDDGRFAATFPLGAKGRHDDAPAAPFGPDGFFYLSARSLHLARRGHPPARHLPRLSNVMAVSPGPPGAVLLKEGENALGDLGKLYFPDDDVFLRITPKLFADEDPGTFASLHWAGTSGRLIAATPRRLWSVPAGSVLSLPRYRASTWRKLRA